MRSSLSSNSARNSPPDAIEIKARLRQLTGLGSPGLPTYVASDSGVSLTIYDPIPPNDPIQRWRENLVAVATAKRQAELTFC